MNTNSVRRLVTRALTNGEWRKDVFQGPTAVLANGGKSISKGVLPAEGQLFHLPDGANGAVYFVPQGSSIVRNVGQEARESGRAIADRLGVQSQITQRFDRHGGRLSSINHPSNAQTEVQQLKHLRDKTLTNPANQQYLNKMNARLNLPAQQPVYQQEVLRVFPQGGGMEPRPFTLPSGKTVTPDYRPTNIQAHEPHLIHSPIEKVLSPDDVQVAKQQASGYGYKG
jgi:hypothetical protein